MAGEKFIGTKFLLLNYLLMPFAIAGIYLGAKYLFQHDFNKSHCFYVEHITKHFPTEWEFKDKLNVVVSAVAHTGLFFLASVLLTMFGRILSGRGGIGGKRDQDNNYIKVCNRVLKNSIEQTYIFFGIFTYWVLKVSSKGDSKEAVLIVTAFLLGRILFLVGYLFNLITGIFVIRAAGFLLNLLIIVQLLLKIFALDTRFKLYNLNLI
jgi:uncharacterized MAPEG superfamily protein